VRAANSITVFIVLMAPLDRVTFGSLEIQQFSSRKRGSEPVDAQRSCVFPMNQQFSSLTESELMSTPNAGHRLLKKLTRSHVEFLLVEMQVTWPSQFEMVESET
jgi:hypothetical protein